MNLQATIERNYRCLKCGRMMAGGPGSGCHGPTCGRPEGHKGAHMTEKEFRKVRRDLFKKPLKKQKVAKSDFLKDKRREFKKGLLKERNLKAPKTLTTKGRVKSVKTIKYRGRKVDVKVLAPVTRGRPSQPMGKVEREANKNETLRRHSQYGLFTEDPISRTIQSGNRMPHIWEAEKSPDGKGATIFIQKYTDSPTKSHVIIEEVKRAENREIQSTKIHQLNSGKVAKSFIADRYGIKGIKWSGRKIKE